MNTLAIYLLFGYICSVRSQQIGSYEKMFNLRSPPVEETVRSYIYIYIYSIPVITSDIGIFDDVAMYK